MKPSINKNTSPSESQSVQHQSLISTPDDNEGVDGVVKKYLQNPLKKLFTYSETWFNLAFGTALNPFYHLGSLAFFFLWIVLVSGVYLYIFFETGIQVSYQSIEYLTHEQWYAGGVMRSLHRYASDATITVVVVHIVREFALDRFRGFRWFSWFTGMVPLWLIVMLGITGYWLVWDQVAQYVAMGSAKLLDVLPFLGGGMARNFMGENINDRF
ncbi:MAG: cytochrome b N-terminal domain-containing protein, partial [Candidatus Marinimicrobia bacterium]|nr:cytochrome b N-terminal domain-containing protein [Candidatus Neomarinimicrobiota bacterium]